MGGQIPRRVFGPQDSVVEQAGDLGDGERSHRVDSAARRPRVTGHAEPSTSRQSAAIPRSSIASLTV